VKHLAQEIFFNANYPQYSCSFHSNGNSASNRIDTALMMVHFQSWPGTSLESSCFRCLMPLSSRVPAQRCGRPAADEMAANTS